MKLRTRIAGLVVAASALAGVTAAVNTSPATAALPQPATDLVRITGTGLDFGDNTFVLGAPVAFGLMNYELDGADITPHLTGYLHLDDVKWVAARMKLTYYNIQGGVLATEYGGVVYASDSLHHVWSVDLAPYEDADIYKVKVATTVRAEDPNVWTQVGYQNVYV
jgi:hypothetical protein